MTQADTQYETISLLDCEDDNSDDIEDFQVIDAEIIDYGIPEEVYDQSPPLEQHLSQPSLKTSHVSNSAVTKSLFVKLVDCYKYPWYYGKYNSKILERIFPHATRKTNSLDISKKLDVDTYELSNSPPLNDMVPNICNSLKNNKVIKTPNKEHVKPFTDDLEILKAVSQRKFSDIDLKKNKGLVGMKIRPKKNKGGINETEGFCTEKLSRSLIDIDKILHKIGTTITVVIDTNTEINNQISSADITKSKTVESAEKIKNSNMASISESVSLNFTSKTPAKNILDNTRKIAPKYDVESNNIQKRIHDSIELSRKESGNITGSPLLCQNTSQEYPNAYQNVVKCGKSNNEPSKIFHMGSKKKYKIISHVSLLRAQLAAQNMGPNTEKITVNEKTNQQKTDFDKDQKIRVVNLVPKNKNSHSQPVKRKNVNPKGLPKTKGFADVQANNFTNLNGSETQSNVTIQADMTVSYNNSNTLIGDATSRMLDALNAIQCKTKECLLSDSIQSDTNDLNTFHLTSSKGNKNMARIQNTEKRIPFVNNNNYTDHSPEITQNVYSGRIQSSQELSLNGQRTKPQQVKAKLSKPRSPMDVQQNKYPFKTVITDRNPQQSIANTQKSTITTLNDGNRVLQDTQFSAIITNNCINNSMAAMHSQYNILNFRPNILRQPRPPMFPPPISMEPQTRFHIPVQQVHPSPRYPNPQSNHMPYMRCSETQQIQPGLNETSNYAHNNFKPHSVYTGRNVLRVPKDSVNVPPGLCDIYPKKNNWDLSYPILPPPLAPQLGACSDVFVDGSIIGRNIEGVVKKINLLPSSKPQQVKMDSKKMTVASENVSCQIAHTKKVTEDTSAIKPKKDIMEDLKKAMVIEKSNLKKPTPAENTISEPPNKTNKPGPLSKKVKYDDIAQNKKYNNTNVVAHIPHKGYSPPILPIPTYDIILSKAPTSAPPTKRRKKNSIQIKTKHLNRVPFKNPNGAKKISLEEYKMRIKQTTSK